jgi:hypothetical protein
VKRKSQNLTDSSTLLCSHSRACWRTSGTTDFGRIGRIQKWGNRFTHFCSSLSTLGSKCGNIKPSGNLFSKSTSKCSTQHIATRSVVFEARTFLKDGEDIPHDESWSENAEAKWACLLWLVFSEQVVQMEVLPAFFSLSFPGTWLYTSLNITTSTFASPVR